MIVFLFFITKQVSSMLHIMQVSFIWINTDYIMSNKTDRLCIKLFFNNLLADVVLVLFYRLMQWHPYIFKSLKSHYLTVTHDILTLCIIIQELIFPAITVSVLTHWKYAHVTDCPGALFNGPQGSAWVLPTILSHIENITACERMGPSYNDMLLLARLS